MSSPRKSKTKTASADNTIRKIFRMVYATMKKIGHSRGLTLPKLHNYILSKYPNYSPSNIIRLRKTLERAIVFGAIKKKSGNRYVLGAVAKSLRGPGKKHRKSARNLSKKRG